MRMKEAIVKRFQQLCQERNIKYNELANLIWGHSVYSI